MVVIDESDYLEHYGILRRSGRYPWGSGKTQSTRNKTFLQMTEELRNQGMSDPDICRAFGIGREVNGVFRPSTTALRAARSIANNQQTMEQIGMAERLKAKGLSNGAIAERMGLPGESSVRALLAPGRKERADINTQVANMLKNEVDEKGAIDIGSGTEKYVKIGDNVSNKVGVSAERLNIGAAILREQGYEVWNVKVPQIGTGKDTTVKSLWPPGTTWGEAQKNRDKIRQIGTHSEDGGRHFDPKHDPIAVSPRRVAIRYKEDGGNEADGVIYVREGAKNLSLGANRYAQVRIQVGEGHYLKGMAMYKDDLPDGVDLVFNTAKTREQSRKEGDGNAKLGAMKKLKDDSDLPFGSVTRPLLKNGKPYSAMNIVYEEGQWGNWSKSLSSQFLSKQSPPLARTQLAKKYDSRRKELDEIRSLTNPTVKRKLLEAYSGATDSDAVHLEAHRLHHNQKWHVILPIASMKPNEVYAPGYDHGDVVVLIRHPHGGTFEIPELRVNNRNPEAKKLLGNARDAVGIHHSVAERLSGADFDGDTVIVIPNKRGLVKHTAALEKLKGFDAKSEYPKYEGMQVISKGRKQQEMGDISNLITDMTIRQASHDKIARAVKHSMVVIDAEKHELDWKRSARENGIPALKKEFQSDPTGGATRGASTLISLARSQKRVPDDRPRYESEGGPIDRSTGRLMRVPTGKTKINSKGVEVPKTRRTTKLAEETDAHRLSSGTPMEKIYADHSNRLKGLANEARLHLLDTPRLTYSPSANKAYANEVKSLEAKLDTAIMNRPLERQAQLVANAMAKARIDAVPGLERENIKKIRNQELANARVRLKLEQTKIEITPEEWNAIQAGAITNNKLSQILDKADMDAVKKMATPRPQKLMSPAKKQRAEAMLRSGATRAEVARALGVSLTTLDVATVGTEWKT